MDVIESKSMAAFDYKNYVVRLKGLGVNPRKNSDSTRAKDSPRVVITTQGAGGWRQGARGKGQGARGRGGGGGQEAGWLKAEKNRESLKATYIYSVCASAENTNFRRSTKGFKHRNFRLGFAGKGRVEPLCKCQVRSAYR
jgi:hypothetical protein